jgi:ferredoxin/flavodoxin---NADP+ reductase
MRCDVDVLIVGAGPAGLYGAYYAGVRGLRTAVIDSLPEPGGQITAMYPEKPIFDIAGMPSVRGRDLVSALLEQADQHNPTYFLNESAITLDQSTGDALIIGTDRGTAIHARTIIITAGIGTFTPRPLPAGEDFLGRGLSYFVPHLEDYAGADVVIVGGGDSACDWTLTLTPLARSVTLVHRRAKFRAHPATVEAVLSGPTTVITDAEVTRVLGADTVDAVELTVTAEPAPRTLPCQRIVAALGFLANLGPMREWGLQLHDNRHIVVDSRMRTNLPGIYAAGDITEYDGKVRLISVGFGEVATAVNNAAVDLDPQAQLFPGHSTDNAPLPVLN